MLVVIPFRQAVLSANSLDLCPHYSPSEITNLYAHQYRKHNVIVLNCAGKKKKKRQACYSYYALDVSPKLPRGNESRVRQLARRVISVHV